MHSNSMNVLNMLQFIGNVFFISLALCIGIYVYRYMDMFYRLIFFQILIYAVVFTLSYVIMITSKQPQTQWLYNIHMFLETGLLFIAAFTRLYNKLIKKI